MVHNGIEYGLMAALAEGLNILSEANIGAADRPKDAETAPLTHPEYYQYDFDLGGDHRGVAAGQRGVELAARPDRRGLRRGPGARRASRATSATAARVAGRFMPRSTRACRRPC